MPSAGRSVPILRPPRPADAEEVHRVIVARDVADLGEPDYTLGELRDDWRASTVDLAADAVVAEDDTGAIVGYAMVRGFGTMALVAPEHEGEGIGTLLLEWAERRARDRGSKHHRQFVGEGDAAGHDLLERAGYERVRSYWRMALQLDAPRPAQSPPLPEGILLRAVALPADARRLYEVSDAAFAANPDYDGETFEEFADELAAEERDTALSRVAERDGTIVGSCLCRRWGESAGFVDLLGVLPDERRRGVGSALLLACFEAFAGAGLREAHLGVASDNPRALAIYERVGMVPRFRIDVLQRPVT